MPSRGTLVRVGAGAVGGGAAVEAAHRVNSRRYHPQRRSDAWSREAGRQLRALPPGAPIGPRSLFGDKHDPYSPGYEGAPPGFKDRRGKRPVKIDQERSFRNMYPERKRQVKKYYSELRRETPQEAQGRKRSIGAKLLRRKNKPGWMMATEDTKPFYFAGYKPGVNPDYTARQVKHFSNNVQKRYTGPRRVAPSAVGKRLVDEQTRTSPLRVAETAAGLGAIAWGGSRSRALGRGLRNGARSPGIDPNVRRALEAAERARRASETVTSPLGRVTGRGIGRLPAPVSQALNAVPKPLRPATATLAGAILVTHAQPVRQKSYSPVVMY